MPPCDSVQDGHPHRRNGSGDELASTGTASAAARAAVRAPSLDALLNDDAICCVADALVNLPRLGPFGVVHLSRCSKRMHALLGGGACRAAREAAYGAWVCSHAFEIDPFCKSFQIGMPRAATQACIVDGMDHAFLVEIIPLGHPPNLRLAFEVCTDNRLGVEYPKIWRGRCRVQVTVHHSEPPLSVRIFQDYDRVPAHCRASPRWFTLLDMDTGSLQREGYMPSGRLTVTVSVHTAYDKPFSTFERLRSIAASASALAEPRDRAFFVTRIQQSNRHAGRVSMARFVMFSSAPRAPR